MAAAKHCNLRMVKRLLQSGAQAELRDKSGLCALDMLHETRRNQVDAQEARRLLSVALLKAQRDAAVLAANSPATGNAACNAYWLPLSEC